MMKNSQLLSILKKLSLNELGAFQKYIGGLYPHRKQQQDLLKYIATFYPSFDTEQLTLESIQQALFPVANNRKKLLNLLSDLKLLAIEFLMWKQQQKPSLEQSLSLIQLLYARGMNKVAEAELNKLTKKINIQKQISPLQLHQLLNFKYFHLTIESSKNTPPLATLKESLKYLNIFHLTNTCKIFCELLNRRTVYEENLIVDIEKIETALANQLSYESNELLYCYQQGLKMHLNQSEEAYNLLKTAFIKNHSTFPSEDQLTLLLCLINFCIPKVMQGILAYEKSALDLHDLGFSTKILCANNLLSKTVFLNAVTIGCRLKAWDWVNKIIEHNTQYLGRKHRISTKKMAKALVMFQQKKYGDTLQLLNSISVSEDMDNSLRIRGLIALCLYEEKAVHVLVNHLKSFESFLNNNCKKLSKAIRERYQRFIKIMRLLLIPPINKNKIIKLLSESTAIFARSFLYSKIKS